MQHTSQAPEIFEELMKPGTRVEVRTRFDTRWSRGFEIAEVLTDGYLVRRLSDGAVLPTPFTAEEVRNERRRDTWWY